MRRWVWVGLLLGGVGCFADPPVVGGTTAGNSSNGTSETTASDASGSGDPSTTSPPMTSSAEVTDTAEVTSTDPVTTVVPEPSTGDTLAETTSSPATSGGVTACTCAFDPQSKRAPGGAHECMEAGAQSTPCPMDFGPDSICMTASVGREGCCDGTGNAVYCPDMEAGTLATLIDCAMTCSF